MPSAPADPPLPATQRHATVTLAGLPPEAVLASPARLEPGATLGHFELLRKIGEGGMGVVYLAQQRAPFERLVALKLVRPSFADPLAEAMFMVERQALARLEHPAIARVYEAGCTDRGELFFAMEWVDGHSLDRWCQRQQPGLAQVLELLLQVCRGVQHAHMKGILHRDLKPANILVRSDDDGAPVVRIIDFGIAATPGVDTPLAAGTKGYMSPEQMRPGEVLDQRTDVYALGVILLELAMQRQHAGFSEWWKLDSLARNAALAAPAPDLQQLPRELRAVVAKAVHPDREQRYVGVGAFAADLRALLEQRPVYALPHTRAYLAGKFVARHRLAVASAGLALALLLGLLLVAILGWRQAERQNRTAELTAAFLGSILAEVAPERAQGLDTRLMRLVLDAAAQRAGRELAEAPSVRAGIEATIAASYLALGEDRTALAMARSADAVAAVAGGPDSHAGSATALVLARALAAVGEREAALALASERQPRVLQRLGPAAPDTLEWSALQVRLLRLLGRIDAAVALGRRQLDLLAGAAELPAAALVGQAALRVETGQALASAGQADAAIALLQEALQLQSDALGPEHFDVLRSRGELGATLFLARRYTQARDLFAAVLPEHVRILGAEHPTTLTIRGNLAAALTLSGDPRAAAAVIRELIVLREKVDGPEHPETLTALGNLAAALYRAGEYAEAEASFRRYLSLCLRLNGAAHPSCAERQAGLGKALRELGRHAEAEAALLEAWQRKQQVQGRQFQGAAAVASELAELYRRMDQPEQMALWQARARIAEGR